MSKIKLKEWADKHNLSYLTANRHFHAGMIPGAVQLDSGTILVEDDSLEQNMAVSNSSDAMSLFLKKTVEFSKNNSSVEDFAAFVISNFQLKLNVVIDGPKYSKNKPKTEEVQAHFQKFIPDQKDIEHLKTVKSLLKEGKSAGDVMPAGAAPIKPALGKEVSDIESLSFEDNLEVPTVPEDLHMYAGVHMYGDMTTEGLVTRSVDLNTTPQQINYTSSIDQPLGSQSLFVTNDNWACSVPVSLNGTTATINPNPTFQPTQKELLSVAKVIETAEVAPRKRGRKPSIKR